MMPDLVAAHLRARYGAFEQHRHAAAETAGDLAAAEHVTGFSVAKPVLLRLDGQLLIAVVAAPDRVNLSQLEEATGAQAELASELELSRVFSPCEPGAEPPFALFGVPIFVDDKLAHEPKITVAAGTHEDCVVLDTAEWMSREHAQPITNLGRRRAPLA